MVVESRLLPKSKRKTAERGPRNEQQWQQRNERQLRREMWAHINVEFPLIIPHCAIDCQINQLGKNSYNKPIEFQSNMGTPGHEEYVQSICTASSAYSQVCYLVSEGGDCIRDLCSYTSNIFGAALRPWLALSPFLRFPFSFRFCSRMRAMIKT